ncbi:amino acid permease, partial [Salmonella enterica]|uniref:amino acid permease n=1 Tax=Salmonella enterica TaxID=28901 RepID=UPI0019D6EC83
MLITVWVFVGIEGAVVVSSRARQRKDIGRATILGLLTALSIYVLVTLLSMGVIQVNQLAQYPNPSMAQVLTTIIRPFLLLGQGSGDYSKRGAKTVRRLINLITTMT